MAVINKPSDINKIWAGSGDKTSPSDVKIGEGWEVEVPPRQYFNWLDNKQDQFNAHVNQHGIPVWDSVTEYQAGKSYTQGSDGVVYIAVQTNANNDPTSDATDSFWREAFTSTGHGQCRLSVTSSTALKLSPYNGSYVTVNGKSASIPNAGISITNAGLAVSTVYYAYLYGTTGALQLELSTTGHSTHTNGVEIKTGDATRTLVGMVATNASTLFTDTVTTRWCINWFNRRSLPCSTTGNGFTITSGSEISITIRNQFLSWADESVDSVINLQAVPSTTAQRLDLVILANNATTAIGQPAGFGGTTGSTSAAGTYAVSLSKSGRGVLPEGLNYVTAYSYVTSGNASVTNAEIQTIIQG